MAGGRCPRELTPFLWLRGTGTGTHCGENWSVCTSPGSPDQGDDGPAKASHRLPIGSFSHRRSRRTRPELTSWPSRRSKPMHETDGGNGRGQATKVETLHSAGIWALKLPSSVIILADNVSDESLLWVWRGKAAVEPAIFRCWRWRTLPSFRPANLTSRRWA